jgi:spermidine synthase
MRRLVLILFFLSGACGLVYQVVWARMLTQVFGTTAAAVGTVLAAFMSGLALGGWFLGRAADRSANPLRFYALLELAVGLGALAVHFLLGRITPIYILAYHASGESAVVLAAARFILAFALVMVPTVFMGATLPVLARFVVRRLAIAGADLSTLYAINTLGAVAGTTACGFLLIGALGIHWTVYLAALGNLAVGAVAWLASARLAPVRGERPQPPAAERQSEVAAGHTVSRRMLAFVLVALGVSGLTSFAYEIYWTRSLVFLMGNSTYAVTTMLAAFLTGIALGSALARQIVDRTADRAALFGWLQVLIAVTAGAALPVLFAFAGPQAIREFVGEAGRQVGLLAFVRFAIAFLVMLVPATLIGATFPLAARMGIVDLRRTGARTGLVYAVNTLGNVAGALLPGFVLLGWLGIQRGIIAMAALNACLGIALLGARSLRVRYLRWAIPAAAAGAFLVLVRVPLDFQFPSEGERKSDQVLFYQDGPSATTKVLFDPETGDKTMSIDGIVIGGNTFTEYKQLLLAHLPKLLLDDVSTELSVGLGSAMLAGESLLHDGVRTFTCVEIEPSVVAGAAFFERENHGVLHNPRLRVVIDDISNMLRTTSHRYRVISADEKTALNYASNGFSYSREYYALLRRHLAPGGIVLQWVPATLPPSQYAMVLKTFAESFPHMLLGFFMPALKESGYNTILIGSDKRIVLDAARMRRAMQARRDAFAGLARYGLTSPEAVLAQFVAEDGFIRNAVRSAPENTLVHPRYEFFSPRDYAVPLKARVAANIEFIRDLRRTAGPALLASIRTLDAEQAERLSRAHAAEQAFLAGYRLSLSPVSVTEIFRQYDAAVALAPWNQNLRARIFLHYSDIAASQDRTAIKAFMMKHAVAVYGRSAAAYLEYSRLLAKLHEPEQALAAARTAVELDPNLREARRVLVDLLLQAGRRAEAESHGGALRLPRRSLELGRPRGPEASH